MLRALIIFMQCLLLTVGILAQDAPKYFGTPGRISLGTRSTVSAFDHDGVGLGTGGQFRIQLSNRVNTDWFADYIMINSDNVSRSEYYHIGWSVLFYVMDNRWYPITFQPYVLAGHCFDYNKKTLISNNNVYKDRWGSAVQAGIGTHINLSPRFDISIMTQYMIHLTGGFEVEQVNGAYEILKHEHSILEGHLLTTAGINYKIFRLWGRK